VADESPHSKKLQELMFRAWETFGDARHLDSDDRVFVQHIARQTADRISVLYGSAWRDALDWVAMRYIADGDAPGGGAAGASTSSSSSNGITTTPTTTGRRGAAAAESASIS
jgi:hypothetical protein